MNLFVFGNKCTHLPPATNVFAIGDELNLWQTNAFASGDKCACAIPCLKPVLYINKMYAFRHTQVSVLAIQMYICVPVVTIKYKLSHTMQSLEWECTYINSHLLAKKFFPQV